MGYFDCLVSECPSCRVEIEAQTKWLRLGPERFVELGRLLQNRARSRPARFAQYWTIGAWWSQVSSSSMPIIAWAQSAKLIFEKPLNGSKPSR